MISEIKDCFVGEFNALAENIMSLDIKDAPLRCKEFEEYKRIQKKIITEIEFELAEKSSTSIVSSAPKGIEMEKSKAPSFSGRTLDYPEFKKGWQKVPGVMWEDSNQVEQIKFKVDAHTKRIISRCNTMAEVWAVLDSEYAQEQEVINAVDEELRKLRSEDCTTPQYIINLRNYLPCLEEALRSVNGLEHLCSPDRVHYLTAKFDERTMYDWELYRPTALGTTYTRFFNFLISRYEASRSMVARLKSSQFRNADYSILPQSVHHNMKGGNDTECRRCRSFIAQDSIYTCPGCGRGTPIVWSTVELT